MRFDQLFLARVFRQNKFLFFLFAGYIFFSFLFNVKGIETTPFFIWAMFSGKQQPRDTYKITTVSYNNGQQFNLPHTFQEPKSMMVYFTLNHYRKIEQNNMKDPLQAVLDEKILPRYPFLKPVAHRMVSSPDNNARYLPWLKKYIQSITGIPIHDMTVYDRWVHYDSNGKVMEDSSKIIYSIQ